MTLVTVSHAEDDKFSDGLVISSLHVLPFQTALRGREGGGVGGGGGCTYCERKPAAATAGEEDAPSLPFCSLQLIDAGCLLPFGLPAQCMA